MFAISACCGRLPDKYFPLVVFFEIPKITKTFLNSSRASKWVPSFMGDPYFQTHIYPPSRQFFPCIYNMIFISGKWCRWRRCKLAYCESNYISAIFPFVEETGTIFNSFLNFGYFHFGMHIMHNHIHCIFSGFLKLCKFLPKRHF